MSTRLLGGALIAAITCCTVSAAETGAQAQSSTTAGPAPSADPRDFQGFWQGPPLDHNFAAGFSGSSTNGDATAPAVGSAPPGFAPSGSTPPGSPPPGFAPSDSAPPGNGALPGAFGLSGALPFKPEVAAKSQRNLQLILKGTPVMTWHVACRPGPGQNVLADDIGGFEVIQTSTRVLFLSDTDNTYWEVYLDRGHPQNVKPSYLGHSVGHWEGNALVVDTIGYNGRGYVFPAPVSSEQLHTVTRFWKDDGGKQLKYETHVEDPLNLTQPATLPVAFAQWTPDHKLYEEHCTQSIRQESNADMIYEDVTREEAFPYLYKK